jgi:hypothetical protein
MKAHVSGLTLPTRDEVLRQLDLLVVGAISPADIESWSERWVLWDHTPGNFVVIDDMPVWQTLVTLTGANLPSDNPSENLHGRDNFQRWAEQLRSAPPG